MQCVTISLFSPAGLPVLAVSAAETKPATEDQTDGPGRRHGHAHNHGRGVRDIQGHVARDSRYVTRHIYARLQITLNRRIEI